MAITRATTRLISSYALTPNIAAVPTTMTNTTAVPVQRVMVCPSLSAGDDLFWC